MQHQQRKISILGSTGSIGKQTLDIVRSYPHIQVEALSANSSIALLENQVREFKPKLVAVTDEKSAKELKLAISDTTTKVVTGDLALTEASTMQEIDTVVTAIVGIAGLVPTVEAIKSKKNIAIANKETLVTAGHIVTQLARENNVRLFPVDSEHSAIFQSLEGNNKKEVKKIILTASGGPFFGKTRAELENVTLQDALNHPNWSMGAKITIDSATLVNKGLEIIEAKWLFDVDVDMIDVVVHRQSIVHSMVEYVDNSVIAQLGVPDMRLPIQYALTYPMRLPMQNNQLDFTKSMSLTFEKPDIDTFKSLPLAYHVSRIGGILPCVYNSADEIAVELFLENKIKFLDIIDIIEKIVSEYTNIINPTLSEILEADISVRQRVKSLI